MAKANELCSCEKHCVRDAILKGSKETFLIYLLANYAGFEAFGENALSLLILSQKCSYFQINLFISSHQELRMQP